MVRTIRELMSLSTADRTDILECFALRQNMETAPGIRTEGEALEVLMRNGPFCPPDTSGDYMARTLWGHYLKAPMLLIKLLELFHPHLLALDRPLRVLYLGAAAPEALDDCRWFDIAWLMNQPGRPLPELTLVGPALKEPDAVAPTAWREMVAELPPRAVLLPGTMREMLATDEACIDWELFDIAVMQHPGFVANVLEWSADEAFMDLCAFGEIPFVGTSFDPVDFAYDKQGLAVCGRNVDQVFWNPAAHINPAYAEKEDPTTLLTTRMRWGGVLWSTQRDARNVEGERNPSATRAVEWFVQNLFPLFDRDHPLAPYLQWQLCCSMQFDDLHQKLLVTDDISIDCEMGRIEALGQVVEPGPAALQALATPCVQQRIAMGPAVLDEILSKMDVALVQRTRTRPPGRGTESRGEGDRQRHDPDLTEGAQC